MPGGGSLHDTWDTRGELPVRRPTCSCCGARAPYADPDTNAPLCGPCFRAAGHHRAHRSADGGPVGAAEAAPAPPSAPPAPEAAMSPARSRTRSTCSRPGCTRPHLAHGLCSPCTSLRRARGLPARRLTGPEMALLDLPAREAREIFATLGAPAAPAPAVATPPNELRRRTEAEWLESYDGVLDESIKACEILGLDTDGDYDYLGTLRELVAEREAIRAEVMIPGAESAVGTSLAANVAAMAKQLRDEVARAATLGAKLDEALVALAATEGHTREATARASRIAEELQAVRADLEGARRAHRLSEAQREVLQVELARASALKEHWQAEGSTLERLHDGAVRDRDEARAEARGLRAELAEAYSALRAARDELAARPVGLRASIAATVKRAAGSLW